MEVAMIKDGHVKELRRLLTLGRTLTTSARMTEMSEKTARKYRDDERLPSERKATRDYRTRVDPFEDVWGEVQQRLEAEPKLKAKTLFDWLQQNYVGRFSDSTRRTFERRVSQWRSLHGPGKAVFFSQVHHPGRLAASDFTVCNELRVTIAGARFDHTLYHCVLTYSNVESVSLCFSESFEALSAGIQKAFWEFGGVPQRHRSDSLAAAVRNHSSRRTLTDRYATLMQYYDCEAERTNARCANENGDVESANGHIKDRLDQALLLRGSREFSSREEYMRFVEQIISRANANRRERFAEERACFSRLPDERLDTDDMLPGVRVTKSSTIQVRTNTYSVPSRLIGQPVDVRVAAEQITVTHQGHVVQVMPRLVGKHQAAINYRHIIDSLVRKPGAFANYRYREEMFPTSAFRMAWDLLRKHHTEKVADKMYVQILELAAHESQDAVADALRYLIAAGEAIDVEQVRTLVMDATYVRPVTDVEVEPPDLSDFDSLFTTFDKESLNDATHESTGKHVREDCVENIAKNTANDAVTEGDRIEGRPVIRTDRTAPPASSAELSRPLSEFGQTSGGGEPQSSGVPLGTGDAGMRIASGGPYQTSGEPLETSGGQDVGLLQIRSTADACDSTAPGTSRRVLSETPRECFAVWEARLGEESRLVCLGGTIDSPGTQHVVHNLQPVSTAIVDRQTRSATAENDQAAVELRGSDYRRSGLRSAESRGDGSAVHAACGALRTRERVVDEQFGVQQVGSDLQGRNDDSGGDRPFGASQRNHRAERTELPCGDSQENKTWRIIVSRFAKRVGYLIGNSSCR